MESSDTPPQQPETPQKDRAKEIVSEIEQRNTTAATNLDGSAVSGILNLLTNSINKADQQAAAQRVQELREAHPDAPVSNLVEMLIKKKCQQTAAVGAATSGAAFIPGIGTIASLTIGVAADIGATFKLQAELVLEIAEAHQHQLTQLEKQQVILLVTGISAGSNKLMVRAGQEISLQLTERYALKWLYHALPIVGVAAAAGTNVLSTYLIGRRAHAYFSLGEAAVGDWQTSLRAISGIDERKIGLWLKGTMKNTWSATHSRIIQTQQRLTDTLPDREAMVRVTDSAGLSLAQVGKGIADGGRAMAATVGKVGTLFARRNKADTDVPSNEHPD